jgi:hypothetical protein
MIGVVRVTAGKTYKFSLSLSIAGVHMTVRRTFLAGVTGWNANQLPTEGREFRRQQVDEQAPTLVKDGTVEAALGFDLFAQVFLSSSGRLGHVLYFQILNCYRRVAFADGGRGFAREILSAIGDSSMDFGQLSGSM